MKRMIDIGLDYTTDDVEISGGDFTAAESTKMHQKQLLQNNKGSFKENPLVCVGAIDFLKDEDPDEFLREVSLQFTKDGMKVNSVKITNDKINVDAEYQ